MELPWFKDSATAQAVSTVNEESTNEATRERKEYLKAEKYQQEGIKLITLEKNREEVAARHHII